MRIREEWQLVSTNYKALLAQAIAARQEWEKRTMLFLAAGNARLVDGTPIKTWLEVHDELKEAETNGVPLSDHARIAIVKMGTAEKAIRAASAAAKLAAEKAAQDYAKTERGAKMLRASQGAEQKAAKQLTAKEQARKLAEEATKLADEAAKQQRAREQALDELREAQHQELLVKWGAMGTWRRLGSRRALGRSSHMLGAGEEPPPPTCLDVFCCCVPPGRFSGGAAGVLPSPERRAETLDAVAPTPNGGRVGHFQPARAGSPAGSRAMGAAPGHAPSAASFVRRYSNLPPAAVRAGVVAPVSSPHMRPPTMLRD